jgi:hypothetical protein
MPVKDSFVLYLGMLKVIENFSLEQKGMMLEAIFNYHNTGAEPTGPAEVKMAFLFFKNQFIQDRKKYDAIVARNSTNGALGGRPKNKEPKKPNGLSGLQKNPIGAKKADTDTDTVTDIIINEPLLIDELARFIQAYPGTKFGVQRALTVLGKHKDKWQIIPQLNPGLEKEKKYKAWLTSSGQFCPPWKNLQTWFNNRCWEDSYPDEPTPEVPTGPAVDHAEFFGYGRGGNA